MTTSSVSVVDSQREGSLRQTEMSFPVSFVKRIPERASTTAQALKELYGQHYSAYYHWKF
jgi:hypothetical protein